MVFAVSQEVLGGCWNIDPNTRARYSKDTHKKDPPICRNSHIVPMIMIISTLLVWASVPEPLQSHPRSPQVNDEAKLVDFAEQYLVESGRWVSINWGPFIVGVLIRRALPDNPSSLCVSPKSGALLASSWQCRAVLC